MYELPAYLFWGFLESGKTTLIKDTLSQDYFNDGEKTMILSFEEGEEEYDKEMLEKTNSFVIQLDSIEGFPADNTLMVVLNQVFGELAGVGDHLLLQ